jgi:outer membrane protein assembly factor BamD (BamD/ComL family)
MLLQKDVDSARSVALLEEVMEAYPLTEYGEAARQQLGYTKEAIIDSVAELFASANSFRRTGAYSMASRQYVRLVDKFPFSNLAPRALYNAGWVHENRTNNIDSAWVLYKRLTEEYPGSIYAKDVELSVLFASAYRDGKDLDSLAAMMINVDSITASPPFSPGDPLKPTLQKKSPTSFDIKDLRKQLEKQRQKSATKSSESAKTPSKQGSQNSPKTIPLEKPLPMSSPNNAPMDKSPAPTKTSPSPKKDG